MANNFKAQQSKIAKIYSRSTMIIKEFLEKCYNFSFMFGIYNTAWWIGNYCSRLVGLQFWATKNLTSWMDDYIESKYPAICNYTEEKTLNNQLDTYLVFVFWWQGEEAMPALVKGCFRQLSQNNDNVVLITKDNFNDYCQIPDYIIQKVEKGVITFTHFSDIIRVSLLSKNGGLWLDSTCWVSGTIPSDIKNKKLISPRTKNLPDLPFWSNSRWCGWGMGSNQKNNPLFVFTRNLFYAYWKDHNCLPFYLFIDYCYDYAYRHISECKSEIDELPENNVKRSQLHFLLNKQYNKEIYDELCKDNWLFKLSYKSQWVSYTPKGELTFYGKLLNP